MDEYRYVSAEIPKVIARVCRSHGGGQVCDRVAECRSIGFRSHGWGQRCIREYSIEKGRGCSRKGVWQGCSDRVALLLQSQGRKKSVRVNESCCI
jgi:hypothetical protein